MNDKQTELLESIPTDHFISTMELNHLLNRSEKTIRLWIKEINSELKDDGVEIISRKGKGFIKHITDSEKYIEWKNENLVRFDMNDTDGRERYILYLLLHAKTYLTRSGLAEEMYVSEKTISADLRQIEKILKNYSLKLERKSGTGISIENNEFKRRQCLMKYFPDYYVMTSQADKKIAKIVNDYAYTYHLNNTDWLIHNLILYLKVMCVRIRSGFEIIDERCNTWPMDVAVYSISQKIVESMQEEDLIDDIRKEEIFYVSLYLWGNRIISDEERWLNNYVVPSHVKRLTKKICDEITKEYDICLDRKEIYNCMLLHMTAFDIRISYGIIMDDPYIGTLIRDYGCAYRIAEDAMVQAEKYYDTSISNNEIGYIALLLQMQMEKQMGITDKILLVCMKDKIGALYLAENLKKVLGDDVGTVEICSRYEFYEKDLNEYTVIFTTISGLNDERVYEISEYQISGSHEYIREIYRNAKNKHILNQWFLHKKCIMHDAVGSIQKMINDRMKKEQCRIAYNSSSALLVWTRGQTDQAKIYIPFQAFSFKGHETKLVIFQQQKTTNLKEFIPFNNLIYRLLYDETLVQKILKMQKQKELFELFS